MKESIFKIGDKVYDARWGAGEVTRFTYINEYPVEVTFISGRKNQYTTDGKHLSDDVFPSLSFTEYNFTTGGFSQERPEPDWNEYVGKWGKFWWDSYKERFKGMFVIGVLDKYNKNATASPFSIGVNSWYQHFQPLTESQIKALELE